MRYRAAVGIAGLTLRGLLGGKRAWAAAFLTLAPALLAILMGAFMKKAESPRIFQMVVFHFSLWFMVYLLALIYGMALSSGEIEDGTAGYLYLGAAPKWLTVLIQIGVTALALTAALFVSLLLTAAGASLAKGGLPHFWRDVFSCTMVGGAGILVSLAFYVTCGLSFRTPIGALAAAVLPTFFWELMVTTWSIKFAAYTITNNLRGLLLPLIFEGRRGPLFRYVRNFQLPDYGSAAMYLSILAGIFLSTAMIAAMNRSIEGREAK